ncbi:MAG TPA: hypothetical protein VGA88_00580 [Burkholderiales bacterium]|jgi:hypothetical protein
MVFKILAGIVAMTLMVVYLGPVVLKLRDPALTGVILVGVAMMLVDLWQSLRSKGD